MAADRDGEEGQAGEERRENGDGTGPQQRNLRPVPREIICVVVLLSELRRPVHVTQIKVDRPMIKQCRCRVPILRYPKKGNSRSQRSKSNGRSEDVTVASPDPRGSFRLARPLGRRFGTSGS
jgi:hypothetical protein